MYSDRVDSVTRATNPPSPTHPPALPRALPTFPSVSATLLPPHHHCHRRHHHHHHHLHCYHRHFRSLRLDISRRIAVYKPSRGRAFPRRSSSSLSFSAPTLVVFRRLSPCPAISLSLSSSLAASPSIFLLPYPTWPYLGTRSRGSSSLFYYFAISLPLAVFSSLSSSSRSLPHRSPLCPVSRFILSFLT